MRGHLTEIVAEQPYLTQRVRALVRFSLSERFGALLPERQSHTGILRSIPDTFVSAKLNALEQAPMKEPIVRVAANPVTLRQTAFDTVIDSAEVTIADLPESDDPNGFDQRIALIDEASGQRHPLRTPKHAPWPPPR